MEVLIFYVVLGLGVCYSTTIICDNKLYTMIAYILLFLFWPVWFMYYCLAEMWNKGV